jgi:hypothetical protein
MLVLGVRSGLVLGRPGSRVEGWRGFLGVEEKNEIDVIDERPDVEKKGFGKLSGGLSARRARGG